MQTLRIEGIPMSLNVYRNAHYYQLNKEKETWERIVAVSVKEQKIKKVDRCRITFEFYFKDKRKHDPDNYSASAKFLLDGMVKAGVLDDDNFSVIEELSLKQGGINKKPYILIHLEDSDAGNMG